MGNVVLNKPATASKYVAPYAASRAVNGTMTPTSRWLCNVVPCWLSVNLQKMVWINRWVVRHMPVAGWREPDYVLTNYKLQGSLDGANWFDLDIVTNNLIKITDRTFSPVSVAFVRVYVSAGLKINPKLASFLELEVYEAPPTSPYLTNLTLSNGTLTPNFAKATVNYTAQVGYDVTQITLTPIAEDPKATIQVNGVNVPSGQASLPQTLAVGSNTISVKVTSLIGELVQNYTITVTRASSPYLTGLTLKDVTTDQVIGLSPTFEKMTNLYTATAANSVSSITVIPVAEDVNGTIKVNGVTVSNGQPSGAIQLPVGTTPITVEVTSSIGGNTYAYTINVMRCSNCLLSTLIVKGAKAVSLTPTFRPDWFTYTTSIPKSDTSVTFTPTAADNPIIMIAGVQVQSGQTTNPIPVEIGDNVINVEVTAAIGGNKQTYVVTVTRRSV